MDINNVQIPNPGNIVIPNDETAGDLKLTTNGDGYGAFVTSFSVEIIEPDITLTKIVEDEFGNNIGGQVVNLGQELTYVIGFQNTGNDNAINFTIRDILPINTILDYPTGITLPPGVSISSYDPATRELVFAIDDNLVEEFDPAYEIRIQVTVVESCQQLIDVCSDLIQNQAFATYSSETNPSFLITDDPSYSTNTGCLITPQTTNFLADLDDCVFSEIVTLCGDSVDLTAADGYDSYSWSTSPSGNPVIGTTQTITVNASGTYYVRNTATAPCQSIDQIFEVQLFGGTIQNPVIPFADEVVICPNDGKELPNIYLCGANDFTLIETSISDATSIIWDVLDESSCPAVSDTNCANEDTSCTWNEVTTGADFTADTAGQYRITINYPGGCFLQFYFNVYENILEPTVITNDIVCSTPGSIIVNDVPSGYEYSLDGINYQPSNVFSISTPGFYTVYIRQIGVNTNPCVFTVPDVQIRNRDFTVTTSVQQPFCYGELGSIQLAANDVEPQYTFTISLNGTIVNTVGPIIENTYEFNNLNVGLYTATIETEDGCLHTEDILIAEPEELEVVASITQPLTCENGEITIYPQGGTPPYFYFINSTTEFQTIPTYEVSNPGDYDITVVDSNNCTASTLISVEAIGEPQFTISPTNIICPTNGDLGSIAINVTNFNGYSVLYSIDNGATFSNSNVFSGLVPGTYEVLIQYSLGNSVCATDAQLIAITENPPITGIAELSTPYSCTDSGIITVTSVSGGTSPYQYSIDGVNFQMSNIFTGLTPGTYAITISDATNCGFITNSITINPLNPPTDMVLSHTPIDCTLNTTTITVDSVTGGTGNLEYQIIAPSSATTPYQTSNIFIGLEPDTYTFQVRDETNCTYSETYTVVPLPTTTVNVVLTDGLDCTTSPDALITGTINGTAPYTYGVSYNGSAFTSLGSTGNTFIYNASNSGNYQFEITDGNGCSVLSSTITVNPLSPPSLLSIAQGQSINCNGESTGALNIMIDPTTGVAPFTVNVNNDTTGINFGNQTTSLPAGTYTIIVTDANLCTDTATVVITEPDAIAVNYSTVDITCTASGVSQGSV